MECVDAKRLYVVAEQQQQKWNKNHERKFDDRKNAGVKWIWLWDYYQLMQDAVDYRSLLALFYISFHTYRHMAVACMYACLCPLNNQNNNSGNNNLFISYFISIASISQFLQFCDAIKSSLYSYCVYTREGKKIRIHNKWQNTLHLRKEEREAVSERMRNSKLKSKSLKHLR